MMLYYLPDIEGLLVSNIQSKAFEIICKVISFYLGRLMAYQGYMHAGNGL